MQALLGQEFPDFLESLERQASGLRANTIKISPPSLAAQFPYRLNPLPWTSSGFWIEEHAHDQGVPRLGRHPYHAAGLYYLQDPSAMAVAELLQPQPGELVLDLCAAPGGKSSQVAGLMSNQGTLVANEVHPQRVWELVENLERLGVRNAVITNETPERLLQALGPVFDRVLVDAPCSGEAMFTKSEPARREWSLKLVQACSLRQSRIMETAAGLVRPGGLLAYSTCTFNPLENEAVVARFLDDNPHFRLPVASRPPGCSAGRQDWLEEGLARPEIEHATRIWPHRSPGEGHFVAIFLREPGPFKQAEPTSAYPACPAGIYSLFRDFCSEALGRNPLSNSSSNPQKHPQRFRQSQAGGLTGLLDRNRLSLIENRLYWIPPLAPPLDGLHVVRPGWWLGTVHRGNQSHSLRFEPSHAMAMGLIAAEYNRSTPWKFDDPEVVDYLRGNPVTGLEGSGWSLVTVAGYALGWGKIVKNILKNHYPRGLRWN